MPAPLPEKLCATCGRPFAWRKKWAAEWEAVRYCSKRCRSEKPGALDGALEEAIRRLVSARGPAKSICPSEAARAVRPDDWRPLMERTRRAARRLHAAGRLRVLQKGREVAPATAKGPIRLAAPKR